MVRATAIGRARVGDQVDNDRHRTVTQNAHAHDRAQVPPNAGNAARYRAGDRWRIALAN